MNSQSHRLVFSRARGFCVAVAETASSTGKSASGERSARRAGGATAAVAAAAALASLLAAGGAQAQAAAGGGALPTGGTVVQGAGTISTRGTAMTIDQTSQRLVADWQSFSIGAGNSVRFVQPSSSSVALNRVVGGDASQIFGSLTANGHVYLQNANGVLFAPGAQVSVGSLVATSLAIDPTEFMQGRLRMSGGNASSGSVVNEGHLQSAAGGFVVLAGPQVGNAGSISTPGGTTAMVAAAAVNVDPTGSGLLTISTPVAAVNARLAQSGTITADGGAVQLAAAATDAAVRTVMQVGGVVRARSIGTQGGQIVLSGGASGMVMVDGQLDASGGEGAQGGTVKVLGERVGLVGAANLDASGGSGGGTVLVGGNWQGHGPEQNALATYVGSGVVLDASATRAGNGGKVVVWSDGATTYTGQANARGGAESGNGGAIEVSGKGTLNFDGGADLLAPNGSRGSLLLDPLTLRIGTVANVNGDGSIGDDLAGRTLLTGDFPGANSVITATRVATLLATGDVTLQAGRSLAVTAPLTVAPGGAASTLSLSSQDVAIDAAVTLNNASLIANGSANVTLNAPVQSLASVSMTSPNIAILAPLTSNAVTLTATSLPGNTIAQDSGGAGTIRTNALTIVPGTGPDTALNVDLSYSPNRIGRLVIGADSADIRVANLPGVPLVVSGEVDGSFRIVANNTSITQDLASPTGGLITSFDQSGLRVQTTGAGDITLNHPGNQFSGPVTFDAAGNVNLYNSGSVYLQGDATGDVVIRAGGLLGVGSGISGRNIDISGAGVQVNGPLTVQAGGRYLVRSSDSTQDDLGALSFGIGNSELNYIVLGGYSGANPTSGNGYYTNNTGTLTTPVGDNPPVTKVYDGTTGFAFAQSGTAATGMFTGSPDPFTLVGYSVNSTGNFTDANAGGNKGHTVAASNNTSAFSAGEGGITYYGLQFAGYTRAAGPHVAGTPGNAVSQITPRAITAVGVDGVDRVYDATTTVGINIAGASLAGLIGSDVVNLAATGATGTVGSRNVGVDRAVAVTGLSLTGAQAGNYTVSDGGGATATITPRGITSTGFTGINRVYDGTTTVAVNGSGASVTGVLGSDSVGVVAGGATGTIGSRNVGTGRPVTITGVGLNGADAANYTVTADTSNATVSITPRGITAAGLDGVDRVYDATTVVGVNAAGATLVGTIGGDVVNLSATGATGTLASRNAGTNRAVAVTGLTLGGADAANYTVSDGGGATATITPRGITASGFTGVDRVYDGTTVVAVNGAAASLTGVLGSDVVTVAPTGATGTVASRNVGVARPVTISGTALAGADAGNYTVTNSGGATVTITPRPVTSSGVTGVDRTYDATTVVAVNTGAATLNNMIAGDAVTVSGAGASGTIPDKNVGTARPVTVSGVALAGGDAGNYTYTGDAGGATVNITPRTIAATGITAINRPVDGSTAVALDTGNAGVAGVLAGDSVGIDAAGATGSVSSPDPGAGKIVIVSGLTLTGSDALNYAVSPTPLGPGGSGPLTVRFLTVNEGLFDDLRFKEYLQAVSDAQEPFRRAMAEALAAGFGKENIRKQLQRGLVFETGLAPPAIEVIESAAKPGSCTPTAGAVLVCAQ